MQTASNPESKADKTERLKCYFSLLSGDSKNFWVESSGLSMLPLFYRGVRVHIITDVGNPKPGQIVVFHRENKYIAHRIIYFNHTTGFYTTKGDTLFHFDGPTSKDEFLGFVDLVEKRGIISTVQSDPEIASLSGKLGMILLTKLDWLPNWVKFLFYFAAFLPGFLVIHAKKLMTSKKGWN
jgi:hypothetical protein